MILPNNGKVVVFDDQWEDVKELIKALSSEKIPFVYYQDPGGDDLPENPLDNVRLIILDLLLVTDGDPSPSGVVSVVAGRLKRVISKNNGPYVLLYWTSREDYKAALESAFENGLSEYAPFLIFGLTKRSSFAVIKRELKERTKKYDSLNAFLFWESMVNKSGGDIFNNFTTIYQKDENWNKKLKGILYALASALTGADNMQKLNNKTKLNTGYLNLNNTLIDTIERNISENSAPNIRSINTSGIGQNEMAEINSKLHFLTKKEGEYFEHKSAGNLYISRSNEEVKKIIEKNTETITKASDIYIANPKLVELDVTPNCDYAQGKYEYIRILPGILIGADCKKKLKPAECNYCCPIMNIEGSVKYILFDFRFLRTTKETQIQRKSKTKFRLRHEILTDIQAKLAKHIIRPGIVEIR